MSDPIPTPAPIDHPVSSTTVTTTAADGTQTSTTATKPWWKSSESYFTLAAMLVSGVYATGIVAPDGAGPVSKAVALAAFCLAATGHAISRGLAKSA